MDIFFDGYVMMKKDGVNYPITNMCEILDLLRKFGYALRYKNESLFSLDVCIEM